LGDESEQQLAEAMIRLYGRDAESVAIGHAETHADMNDPIKAKDGSASPKPSPPSAA